MNDFKKWTLEQKHNWFKKCFVDLDNSIRRELNASDDLRERWKNAKDELANFEDEHPEVLL